MKTYKHCCVVDLYFNYVDFVLVNLVKDDKTGDITETIEGYTLSEGQSLIETIPPTMKLHAGSDGFISPAWNGNGWIETATEEEIAEWDAENPAPVFEPTDLEKLQQENKLLKAQVKSLSENISFLEDCLIEVGQVIYA